MKVVSRNTVTAAIDASAYVENRWLALRYVKPDGSIKDMVVKKTKAARKSLSAKEKKEASYRVKENSLVRIIDKNGEIPKSLFLFAIIGFNPYGDVTNMYRVSHGS